jgi:hypothetical protein
MSFNLLRIKQVIQRSFTAMQQATSTDALLGLSSLDPGGFFPERQSSLAVEDAIAFWIGG